jgi:hypothetical protein
MTRLWKLFVLTPEGRGIGFEEQLDDDGCTKR